MGDVKNLTSTEAVQKIKELVESTTTGIMVTNLSRLPLSARPMATQKVDDDGTLWFLSKEDSEKNLDITRDSRVQVFYSNNSSYEYLSLYGEAEILKDKQKLDEVWTPIAKTWFTEGKDDPSITLIKITPTDAYYWDTKSNKLVSLFKIAAGAITGKTMDNGVQGKLTV